MTATIALPSWVYKRDGRLVPFDPDQITLALFDASESVGAGNAFLARELTDGILYFLAEEIAVAIPTTTQLVELVVKIVRELGHPALARAFLDEQKKTTLQLPQKLVSEPAFKIATQDSPAVVVRKCLTAYSLNTIYSRDLRAAAEEGLIGLHGLTKPLELFAWRMDFSKANEPQGKDRPPYPQGEISLGLLQALYEARDMAGDLIAFDSPEQFLQGDSVAAAVEHFGGQLRYGLKGNSPRFLLNLGSATTPPWDAETRDGPLFSRPDQPDSLARFRQFAELLSDYFLRREDFGERVQVDWHLSETDFQNGKKTQPAPGLLRLARLALEKPALGIIFDRPRRPHFLGSGLDRKHPTALLAVDLHLPKLFHLPGVAVDPELFLKKVASLAGMAMSAGFQKRAYLRERNRGPDGTLLAVHRRFLLARARLVVVPVGLEESVRHLTGRGFCEGTTGLDLGQRILKTIAETLQAQGNRMNLPVCLSGGDDTSLTSATNFSSVNYGGEAVLLPGEFVSGLTPWDSGATLLEQIRAAGQLHPFGERATVLLVLASDRQVSPEEVAELLRFAWRETAVQRLTFRRLEPRQLTLSGLWNV